LNYGGEPRNSFWRIGNLIGVVQGEVLEIPEIMHRLAASYVPPSTMTARVDMLVL